MGRMGSRGRERGRQNTQGRQGREAEGKKGRGQCRRTEPEAVKYYVHIYRYVYIYIYRRGRCGGLRFSHTLEFQKCTFKSMASTAPRKFNTKRLGIVESRQSVDYALHKNGRRAGSGDLAAPALINMATGPESHFYQRKQPDLAR